MLGLAATAATPNEDFTRHLVSSFPSPRDTLVHAAGADAMWLERAHLVRPAT